MSDSIIERLRHHAQDERNTAFARSTMREAEQELARVTAQRDAILMQARIWSGEAKSQKATVDQVGAILGGVPDWGPIAAGVEKLRADLAASQAECERLTVCLNKANSQAEHFEREWYLRGDEIERLRADFSALQHAIVGDTGASAILTVERLRAEAERLDWLIANSDATICNAGPNGPYHVWFRHRSIWTDGHLTARAAIDAARAGKGE